MTLKTLRMSVFILISIIVTESATVYAQRGDRYDELGKVLIIYYSYNGTTKTLAEIIKLQINADIYAIKTIVPYDNATINEVSKKQLSDGFLPPVALTNAPDPEDYDLVLIGAPVWWNDVPPPAKSFLTLLNFANTKVALFCTNNGTTGAFFSNMRQLLPNSKVVSYKEFRMLTARPKDIAEKADVWLGELALAVSAFEPDEDEE